jgi:hypothetical protein
VLATYTLACKLLLLFFRVLSSVTSASRVPLRLTGTLLTSAMMQRDCLSFHRRHTRCVVRRCMVMLQIVANRHRPNLPSSSLSCSQIYIYHKHCVTSPKQGNQCLASGTLCCGTFTTMSLGSVARSVSPEIHGGGNRLPQTSPSVLLRITD